MEVTIGIIQKSHYQKSKVYLFKIDFKNKDCEEADEDE
jgi:hypothetical protein